MKSKNTSVRALIYLFNEIRFGLELRNHLKHRHYELSISNVFIKRRGRFMFYANTAIEATLILPNWQRYSPH